MQAALWKNMGRKGQGQCTKPAPFSRTDHIPSVLLRRKEERDISGFPRMILGKPSLLNNDCTFYTRNWQDETHRLVLSRQQPDKYLYFTSMMKYESSINICLKSPESEIWKNALYTKRGPEVLKGKYSSAYSVAGGRLFIQAAQNQNNHTKLH